CVIGAILAFRPWKEGAFAKLAAPSRRALMLLAAITYVSFVPTLGAALSDDVDRGELPWWGDSIGLPLFSFAFVILVTLPMLLAVVWFGIRRAQLPASLWGFDRARPIASLAATLILGGLALGIAYTIAREVIVGSPYAIPPLLCSAYVVLCVRAALLAPRVASAPVTGTE
ncbi:MAG TPA: hypothetical protein VHN20_11505, partial [Beijerinckiaceae bacterium]|nr:hypothetical protein [Beijerinckiaceae bacterium]